MSITRPNPFQQADKASGLSVQQLQQAIQNGTVPEYIGIPLLKEKVKSEQQLRSSMAAQQPKPPTVVDQVMAEAQQVGQGVPALQSNLPTSMAAGGIIAFAGGGETDDDMPTFTLPDEEDEAAQDAEDEMLYGSLGRTPRGKIAAYAQTFEQGIGSLPAAEKAAGPKKESFVDRAKEGTSDFIDRIMQKESRGQRYGKDGQLLTSPKGAQGEMQVMPGTSRDPGYGVAPARDSSPDELARVGRDYANALLDRYGDPKLAAIAYNMGPGATDKWLSAGADMSKLPKETQGYVKGFAGGGAIRFQNRGIVENLPEDDYTSIPGMYQSNEYERALRRAKGVPQEETKPRYTPGQTLPGFTERMTTPEPMGIEGLQPSTKYADAMRAAKGLPTPPTNKLTLSETFRGMFTPEAPEGAVVPRSVEPSVPRGPSQTKLPVGYKVDGPSADANTMQQIDIVGRQLDEARAEFSRMRPPGQRQLQADPSLGEKYNAARDRMNALQQGYENLMGSTGMNQAAFGQYRGALGTKPPQANPMVQAMGAQQPAGTPQYPGAPEKNVAKPVAPSAPSAGKSAMDKLTNAKPTRYDQASEADDQSFGLIQRDTGKKEVAETAASTPVSRLDELLGKREANLEKQRSVDNYMALLSAGLGMMGGTSQHALTNIGAGAQQGVANLMQSNKLRTAEENALLSGRLGQERYKNTNQLQEARLAESKLNRERLTRADLADNLRSHEQQAERMAIQQIGQDKLGALDPAAQAAAIARKKAEILNSSPVFQTEMREYMGNRYVAPQAVMGGGAAYTYDPTKRTLSGR
jgi:hypothetical protein